MKDRVLVGTRKGTFAVEKLNGGWRPRLIGHAGSGVNFVARDPNTNVLWALLGHGHWGAKLSRSNDDGKTWEDAPQIVYPEGARHYADVMPTGTDDPPKTRPIKDSTLLKLWIVSFGSDGRIYIGTIPGGLFESSDGGNSFELNRPLWNHESRGGDLFTTDGLGDTHWWGTPASEGEFAPGIHSISVDAKDPKRVLVAISTAGVLETIDGGKTWRGRNKGLLNDYLPDPAAEWGHDAHYVEICKEQPNHVWQQNHSGVFYSSDGAATWKRVSRPEIGVHFGFPVAVDEQDGRCAWLVPGKSDNQRTAIDGALFVARTTDGGENWEALRNGLPQENAYDVVYRHALANAGNVLAFGSTTGNLYMSENRGDAWATAANNLPPIYSVRFG